MNRVVTEKFSIRPVGSHAYWAAVAAILAFVGFAFSGPIAELIKRWSTEQEYGHGFLLPFVSLYFLWVRWPLIAAEDWRPGWMGPAVSLVAILVFVMGKISAMFVLSHYALVLLLFGIGASVLGLRTSRHLVVSLTVLLFAIPFPYFIQMGLSTNLQLISSSIGVAIISAFGIPVILEGNVIDMGVYKLQVVEACSGLRYLFSLASLGFICACLYHDRLWKRVLIVLSTIPIAILTNSARIGITGLLVERYGIGMAEGFMHDFEGWSIFAVCLGILVAEMALLARIGKPRRTLRAVFGIEPLPPQPPLRRPSRVRPLLVTGVLVLAGSIAGTSIAARVDLVPQRQLLAIFPQEIEGWQGEPTRMRSSIIEILKLNDYLLADYFSLSHKYPVNLYVAWYDSQRSGAAPHSPKLCIPAGGWEISAISRRELPFSTRQGALPYNRAVIQKGQQRQLVYYWFQQRGRAIANEYVMKWYVFHDALVRHRSDGALVRLTTPLGPGEALEAADRRLTGFALAVAPQLPAYVPD